MGRLPTKLWRSMAGPLLVAAACPLWVQSQSSGGYPGSGTTGSSSSSAGIRSSQSSSSQTSGTQTSGSQTTGYSSAPVAPAAPGQTSFSGSVVGEKLVAGVRSLSLEDAITLGLRNNLGLILSSQNVAQAGGQKLKQLQELLPVITGDFREAAQQTNLKAQGLSIPGFPTIIGPYGYTDVRANMNWTLVNVSSLRNYLAARHNLEGTRLSLADARDLVVLTVGGTYLRCIADQANIDNDQAQVNSTRLSLDQAAASHQAGASPQIDELRARVDYQTQQQQLIADQNGFEKDKIALERAIGLSLEQKIALTDQSPYAPLANLDQQTALSTAYATRKDLQSLAQQVSAAQQSRSGATAERFPTLAFQGDYGDIGQTLGHSHGTFDVVGTASVPIFQEAKLRGDAQLAQAQLDRARAHLGDLRGQIDADVQDSFLDLQSTARLVEVARSNAQLAAETLAEAQERFAAGVSDNLPVTQAQAAVAQANSQYVSSLYQNNFAKLELARAMGIVDAKYKEFLGGK